MAEPQRVLGVDPGSVKTGWGVVVADGPRLVGLGAGVLSATRGTPLPERLHTIHAGLQAVIREHRPHVVAVEDIFYSRHANAALKLGHVRGVVLLAAAQAGLAVHAYPPAIVKRTVAGHGRAEKDQIARLVGAILGWSELPAVDATDAIAIAITHLSASHH